MRATRSTPRQSGAGWGASPGGYDDLERLRRREILPPIAAVLLIAIANLAFGAVMPMASLPLSAAIIVLAVIALGVAGPSVVSAGMLISAAILFLVTVTGLAGPLHQSGAHLATIFAAGGMWILGYIAAQRRAVLDAVWTTLIWSSIAWCAWMFFAFVSTTRGDATPSLADAFQTPANGAVVFGLMSVVGLARVLRVLKRSDAEALAIPQVIDQLLREGVGGLLLLVGSLTCLVLLGSIPGLLFVGAVLLIHAWWDLLPIIGRERYGILLRVGVIATPVFALALAIAGVATGWSVDETITPGLGLSDTPPFLQRIDAYTASWMESPLLGHGLGSLAAEGARHQTLENAKVMLAPGGAHNVFLTWLVETGLLGLALFLATIAATHLRIFRAVVARKGSRTFPHMALAAGLLLLLHGITDSSLNVPAVAWLYALLVGAACGLAPARKNT
jgi:O-antigen ligase